MGDYLMVSATARGEALWFDEWLDMNRGGVHTVRKSTRTVTMHTGDVFRFVLLSPTILSMEVDAVFFDDRAAGRLTPEQEEWLRILPTRVRPKMKKTPAELHTLRTKAANLEHRLDKVRRHPIRQAAEKAWYEVHGCVQDWDAYDSPAAAGAALGVFYSRYLRDKKPPAD